MSNKTARTYAKYALELEGRDVHARFSAAYNEASKGKIQLLSACVAGGFLLRECGLLTLTTEICESEEYVNATSISQRRTILLRELLNLSGMSVQAPVQPHNAVAEPLAAPTMPEVSEDAAEHHVAAEAQQEEQEPAPAVVKRPAVRLNTTTPLPNLGASTSPPTKK